METHENSTTQKNRYQKVSYDVKMSIIDQIANGQLSAGHAAKIYNIPKGSIEYWIRKFLSFEQKSKVMSKNDEIKKLKKRIEELEAVKEFQQEIIAEVELETGVDIAKKSLPEPLVKEIEKKKKLLIKQGFSTNASGSQNKPSPKE